MHMWVFPIFAPTYLLLSLFFLLPAKDKDGLTKLDTIAFL